MDAGASSACVSMSKSNRGNFFVGLDIGSAFVRTVIAQEAPGEDRLRVIGVGSVPSQGMRRGAVVDIEEAVQAVNSSVEQAETMAGMAAQDVMASIGGTEIFAQDSKGVVAVGKADGEVLSDDIQRVLQAAQSIPLPLNKEILHVLPKSYRLDDQKDIKDPLGMHGVRLEVDALIIGGSSPHVKNMARCIERLILVVQRPRLQCLRKVSFCMWLFCQSVRRILRTILRLDCVHPLIWLSR